MGILMNPTYGTSQLIKILLISLCFSISLIKCQSQTSPTIKILGQVYMSLPQISDQDYSVVPQVIASTAPIVLNPKQPNLPPVRQAPPIHRFDAKKKADYFVTQAVDANHQATRYNFIKGKNIFTPAYIKSQVLEEPEEGVKEDLSQFSKTLKEEFSKNFEELKQKEKTRQTIKPQEAVTQSKKSEQQKNPQPPTTPSPQQQSLQAKTSQIYKEFKKIQALKQKNLRGNGGNSSEQQKYQNMQKLIGYIVIGLVISFAILKRVSKSPEATLPKTNQERTELRLRDTADDEEDDEDEEDEESDDSNE